MFAGGATLDSAEGVCAEPDEPDILTTLAGLLDKSLLVDTDDPRGGEPRLRMLETIRSYAWEKLVERGEADDLRRRHLACFSALGRYAHPYLCGPGQRDWSARLDPERTNIRAAINAGLEMREYGVALQLTWDTFVYYYIRDAFQEPREWIDRIAAHRSHLDEVERAKLDVALAIVGNAPEGFDVRSRLAEDAVRALAGSDAVRTRLQTPGWTAFEQVVGPLAAPARTALAGDVCAALEEEGRRADPFVLLDTILAELRSRSRSARR